MGSSTRAIFGNATPEPALPGSYGIAPPGYRLPSELRLGAVTLRVSDLRRSIDWYGAALGLRVVDESGSQASLAAAGEGTPLVHLVALGRAAPARRPPRLGLFHFAILLPDRPALGRFVGHLAASRVPAGAGDHLVSEAFYLNDPDGLGIEVYADRPRESWRRVDRQLMMATDPVAVDELQRLAGDAPWRGMPAGTTMGHLHLHVGDLAQAARFYSDALGFDRMGWSYPGALFLGAGGYHHHLGTNVWAGPSATAAAPDEPGLAAWTIELPSASAVDAVAESLSAAGYGAARNDGVLVTADPWGTPLHIRAVA